eukprot:CAMPEP_0202826148 /NCGR_PEP_ID=MMETSP1389-20130828/13419_1 /ASSEMBLY_ACC=CAM_ASM_000865 /TAXON_ID=302021 /ORGANISM="Rhodomonas sp., Strain CCMP768" /LENGTH=56 /DNA_ID=CAMNT_0049499411 /DNA_START=221 /DNA_END=389 /DNA_ORIENTATION=-
MRAAVVGVLHTAPQAPTNTARGNMSLWLGAAAGRGLTPCSEAAQQTRHPVDAVAAA